MDKYIKDLEQRNEELSSALDECIEVQVILLKEIMEGLTDVQKSMSSIRYLNQRTSEHLSGDGGKMVEAIINKDNILEMWCDSKTLEKVSQSTKDKLTHIHNRIMEIYRFL